MERAKKAYKNPDFLNSSAARAVRILTEYIEPKKRFDEAGIKHTVVFFGSSRIREGNAGHFPAAGKYYREAEEFAYRLAAWSNELEQHEHGTGFTICTGGGPGIMEAANRGAARAKASSIGLNISIPHEQVPNDYITKEFNFEFHYFFMRKLWFLYHAKALVVFPGGFGTLDELFETLTLIQTKKLPKHDLPILLYDPGYWESMINFPKLVEYGMISPDDLNLFHYFSSPDEGMEILKPQIEKIIATFNDKERKVP
jgi:uncharacterized protein (TIGR00730 family)